MSAAFIPFEVPFIAKAFMPSRRNAGALVSTASQKGADSFALFSLYFDCVAKAAVR